MSIVCISGTKSGNYVYEVDGFTVLQLVKVLFSMYVCVFVCVCVCVCVCACPHARAWTYGTINNYIRTYT